MKISDKDKRLISMNIISATHTSHQIERLSFRGPFQKEIKKYGNLYIKALIKNEPMFEAMADDSNDTEERYNNLFDMLEEVGKIDPEEMRQVTNILRARRIDQKPICDAAIEVMEKHLDNEK